MVEVMLPVLDRSRTFASPRSCRLPVRRRVPVTVLTPRQEGLERQKEVPCAAELAAATREVRRLEMERLLCEKLGVHFEASPSPGAARELREVRQVRPTSAGPTRPPKPKPHRPIQEAPPVPVSAEELPRVRRWKSALTQQEEVPKPMDLSRTAPAMLEDVEISAACSAAPDVCVAGHWKSVLSERLRRALSLWVVEHCQMFKRSYGADAADWETPLVLHLGLSLQRRGRRDAWLFAECFRPRFEQWLDQRNLSGRLEYSGTQRKWHVFSYLPTEQGEQADRSEEAMVEAFHGTWWYSLWLVLQTGVVLESNDKEKGHDFNSCAGVFCSPDVCTAEQYARPQIIFQDGMYHRVIFQLLVQRNQRQKRKHGREGVQWILPMASVKLKALWIRLDAPPRPREEALRDWCSELEAVPQGCSAVAPLAYNQPEEVIFEDEEGAGERRASGKGKNTRGGRVKDTGPRLIAPNFSRRGGPEMCGKKETRRFWVRQNIPYQPFMYQASPAGREGWMKLGRCLGRAGNPSLERFALGRTPSPEEEVSEARTRGGE
ncbi:unnamed protein product [Effrenium voratum]|nr:unnamed protein product [Effrenium voratum]